jgi:hypothetical protein
MRISLDVSFEIVAYPDMWLQDQADMTSNFESIIRSC